MDYTPRYGSSKKPKALEHTDLSEWNMAFPSREELEAKRRSEEAELATRDEVKAALQSSSVPTHFTDQDVLAENASRPNPRPIPMEEDPSESARWKMMFPEENAR